MLLGSTALCTQGLLLFLFFISLPCDPFCSFSRANLLSLPAFSTNSSGSCYIKMVFS
ncbi:hypothetical protein ES288_D04G011700v1 [Gossypium darwinii]|uniref:Uncharacterized protein n=2 Tax=Gossypium TaxID=3633 RepID=A0A5D2L8C0_GOSTO|nr:hypothetical protein ES288_D04G011700v1 [Gossypium darwinii]TYH75355.1 hypothetical protein ES332_D04G013400v1 [Gossypium tomentosum]